jgi:hypothetical protein
MHAKYQFANSFRNWETSRNEKLTKKLTNAEISAELIFSVFLAVVDLSGLGWVRGFKSPVHQYN